MRQSDVERQSALQSRAVDDRESPAPELTEAHRLTYDTARAIGQYMVVRTGVTSELVQDAAIKLCAAILLETLQLERNYAERVVMQAVLGKG